MKKKIFALLVFSIMLITVLVGCNISLKKIQLSAGEDASLNTLMLTDIRFDGSATDEVRRNMITSIVESHEPEFIAINGNIVNCQNNGEVMKKAAEFIDSFGIPWATTIGELDVKGNTSKDQLMKILTSRKLKNSMVMRGENYNYNYVLEVVDSKNAVKNLLYFLDTSERCSDQLVEWYKNTVINLSFKYINRQGEKLNSHIFVNKALPGFADYTGINGAYVVDPWENSAGLQKALVDLDSTRSVFAGYENKAKGANFPYKDKIRFAYVQTLAFDSSMSGKNYEIQRGNVGYSYYGFHNTSYVSNISSASCNPESFRPLAS